MKRWIHSSTDINPEILYQAQQFAKRFKGSRIDLENHEIVIPFDRNSTEDEIFNEMGMGTWFQNNGFDVKLERKDIEYTTKGEWLNYRGWQKGEDMYKHAKYNSREDKIRRDWFSNFDNYPDVDPQRLQDALSIEWDDVTAEDSEFIVQHVPDLDLADILSIRYFTEEERQQARDQGYSDGYVVEYVDRSVKNFAFYDGDDDIYDIDLDDNYINSKTAICGEDSGFDTYVVDVIHEIDPGHDTAGPEAAEEIYTIQAISPEEAIERAIKVWGEPYDDVRILAVNPEDIDDVDIPFDFKDDDAKYYKNKLENDWAMINEDYYRRDAEDAYKTKY